MQDNPGGGGYKTLLFSSASSREISLKIQPELQGIRSRNYNVAACPSQSPDVNIIKNFETDVQISVLVCFPSSLQSVCVKLAKTKSKISAAVIAVKCVFLIDS